MVLGLLAYPVTQASLVTLDSQDTLVTAVYPGTQDSVASLVTPASAGTQASAATQDSPVTQDSLDTPDLPDTQVTQQQHRREAICHQLTRTIRAS